MAIRLDELLQSFWQLEGYDNKSTLTEEQFQRTVIRDNDGRFIVTLTISNELMRLGNSRQTAWNRFYSLERKWKRKPNLQKHYIAFIREYVDLNHMRLVDNCDVDGIEYFLPQHAIIKSDSLTTKLTVVFDGSAKTYSGYSLNDIVLVELTIQGDVFRFNPFSYTQMCSNRRNVQINKNHTID